MAILQTLLALQYHTVDPLISETNYPYAQFTAGGCLSHPTSLTNETLTSPLFFCGWQGNDSVISLCHPLKKYLPSWDSTHPNHTTSIAPGNPGYPP
jgi:hypothetical protein